MMHYIMRLSLTAYVFAEDSRTKAAKIKDTWFVNEKTRMLPSL